MPGLNILKRSDPPAGALLAEKPDGSDEFGHGLAPPDSRGFRCVSEESGHDLGHGCVKSARDYMRPPWLCPSTDPAKIWSGIARSGDEMVRAAVACLLRRSFIDPLDDYAVRRGRSAIRKILPTFLPVMHDAEAGRRKDGTAPEGTAAAEANWNTYASAVRRWMKRYAQ